ncbi:MAG: polysaccharide biosynthesis tyrosine autokinase [Actinomycetota bacterium]
MRSTVDSELTLRDYVQLLRRRIWVVVMVFVLALIAAAVWSALQTPMYRATARVLINQASAAEIFDSQSTQNTSFADRVAANEVALIESQLVEDVAQARLGFEAEVNASAQSRADVISISATDPDPFVAQQIAQTYAVAYLDVRRDQYVNERVEVAQQLLDRIGALDDEIAAAGEEDGARLQVLRDGLADQYDRLNISADLSNTSSARIIDEADFPEQAFSPQVARNLALGGVLGLLLGVGAALLLESLDRSVRSRDVIESLTPGVSSLAVVPALRAGNDMVTLTNPGGPESEVFGTLRAALEFAAIDDDLTVLQVTSAGASAGKTTIAANLAVAMAQAGQTVAVIDGDLRRPRLHELFGLEQVPGLTSAILGRETLNTAARELRLDNGRLRVYPSGPVPPGPAELLGSKRAGDVFDALRRSFDVVIIDSPPVLPVADALVLSRIADATLIVANAKRTRRDDLQRSFDSLQQAGARVIGTVLNQASGSSLYGYGYGYAYGYGNDGGRLLGGLLRRDDPKYAPQRAGTQTLDRSELPKFEAARPARRVDEEAGAGASARAIPSVPAAPSSGRPKPRPPAAPDSGLSSSAPAARASLVPEPAPSTPPTLDEAADGTAGTGAPWDDDIVIG